MKAANRQFWEKFHKPNNTVGKLFIGFIFIHIYSFFSPKNTNGWQDAICFIIFASFFFIFLIPTNSFHFCSVLKTNWFSIKNCISPKISQLTCISWWIVVINIVKYASYHRWIWSSHRFISPFNLPYSSTKLIICHILCHKRL